MREQGTREGVGGGEGREERTAHARVYLCVHACVQACVGTMCRAALTESQSGTPAACARPRAMCPTAVDPEQPCAT